jgi:hypothetical protein
MMAEVDGEDAVCSAKTSNAGESFQQNRGAVLEDNKKLI